MKPTFTFFARTPYHVPGGFFARKFDGSILDWFRKNWGCGVTCKEKFGFELPYLDSIFLNDQNFDVRDHTQLKTTLSNEVYGNFSVNDNFVAQSTDDDEFHFFYIWVDTDYVHQNPKIFSILNHDGWLPERPRHLESSSPCTYVASRYSSQTSGSNVWDFVKVPGTSLDKIGDVVEVWKEAEKVALENDTYFDSAELIEFVSKFPKSTSWKTVVCKLVERNEISNDKSEFQCSLGICELNHHIDSFSFPDGTLNIFSQLKVFDDSWAKFYPDLFRSIRLLSEEKLFGLYV